MKAQKVVVFLLVLSMMVLVLAACAPKAAPTPTATPVKPTPVPPTATPVPPTPVPPTATPVPPTNTPAPKIADKVVVAIGSDPSDLSPFVGMSMGRIAGLKTLYEYLVEVDKMGGSSVPMIAKSVEKVGDKTYKATIFDYVYDSAGNHITAADVAWSFNTGMASGKMRPLGDIVSVTATGDYTVEFVFKVDFGPGGLDKLLTECPIVSRAAYEAPGANFATHPIATGPYVLKEYVPGSSMTFERRKDYWQTDEKYRALFSHANVQKIVFQIITEPAQHAIALETGNVDISSGVSQDDLPRFQNNPDYTTFNYMDNLTQNLAFNGSKEVFQSQELRQAIAYAIDTKAMCDAIAPGACTPSHTLGNSNFGGYQAKWDNEPNYEFDLAKAQQLFAASGHKAGELTFTLLGQNDTRTGLMTQIIQSQLKELGITVNINLVEPAVYNQLSVDKTAYDMVINAAAGGDFIFNPWLLAYDQKRNNGTTSNFFKDDQLQALLETASSASGYTPENVDAFKQYQQDKLYVYALLSWNNIIVARKGVTTITRDTRGQVIPGACEYSPDFK